MYIVSMVFHTSNLLGLSNTEVYIEATISVHSGFVLALVDVVKVIIPGADPATSKFTTTTPAL
jgi:ribosomal protein S12 methylthiotransferase accessory factor YcaO